MTVSFGVMLGFLQRAIAEIKDPRLASNATHYSIKDTVVCAFSVFFMQCESFLEHQRQMHSRYGQDNAQSLFGLTRIPTTPQIRNILDKIAASGLFRVFTWLPEVATRWLFKTLSLSGWTFVGDVRRHSVLLFPWSLVRAEVAGRRKMISTMSSRPRVIIWNIILGTGNTI
ncbi:hypothetical protein [Nostoc sp.]|uniref:hypothetical protein n=1 Tax=Nostoc sp. TaxID=1180 RepID=UPI003FA5A295